MRPLVLAAIACAACGPRATPSNTKLPEAGVSIALYRSGTTSYGVVDDRRWIDVSGSSIFLGNIDPGAALASLVIEAQDAALHIGPCTRQRLPDADDVAPRTTGDAVAEERARLLRERVPRRHRRPVQRPQPTPASRTAERFAPIVQCDVAGQPGRHLVRIVYVSTQLTYRAQHDIEMTDPASATIESRFAVQTPPWRTAATITLFDGVPGGAEPPREIIRGPITLDGGTGILPLPSRTVPAQLRRVFEGASFDSVDEEDFGVGTLAAWATLEIPGVELMPGPVRVHVDVDGDERWIDLPEKRRDRFADERADAAATEASRASEPLRLALWVDPDLHGTRQRMVVENDGVRMVEVVALTMTNVGDTPREVWLEEHARPAKRRTVERAWPKKPRARGDVLRNTVVVKPGRVERVGYAIVYEL